MDLFKTKEKENLLKAVKKEDIEKVNLF